MLHARIAQLADVDHLAHAAPPFWAVAAAATPSAPPALRSGLWDLFRQSLDVFTIALLLGSLFAVAVIVRCATDIRASKIAPPRTTAELEKIAAAGRFKELRSFAHSERGMLAAAVAAGLAETGRGRDAMLDAAEASAASASSRHLRKVELLGLIGNIAPLVGLAGTVWGMVLAFQSLGATEGQAGPAELSVGISKALFHTLLGLVLAIPCLLVTGIYRAAVERLCGGASEAALRLVDRAADAEA